MASHIEHYQVEKFEDLPVKEIERRRTDVVCIIINTLFVVLLFVISIAILDTGKLAQMTYPADGIGRTCGYDLPGYPMLYYASLTDPVKRLCVSQCPKAGQNELKCAPTKSIGCAANANPKYEVNVYDSELEQSRLGLFCWPSDKQAKEKLIKDSGLQQKHHFLAFYDTMWITLGIAFGFGCIYLALVQLFPMRVVPWTLLIGGGTFLILGIVLIFAVSHSVFLRIIVGIIFIVLAIICLYTLWDPQRRKSVYICSRMMKISAQIVESNYAMLLVIPIFVLFLFGFLVLIGFQILAAWSIGQLTFYPQYPFHGVHGFFCNFLTLLILFEFYWGLSILKLMINFIFSGYATLWYRHYERQIQEVDLLTSVWRLIRFHWGSVVGGALLQGFFYFFDLLLDFFLFEQQDKPTRVSSSRRASIQQKEDVKQPVAFLNLMRSQSMAMINFVSIPYCNAARFCEKLAHDSGFYDHSQTTSRVYRLGAHGTLITIIAFIAIFTMIGKSGLSSIYGMIFIIGLATFMITFFIGVHPDLAEGVLIGVFLEEQLDQPRQLQYPPESVKKLYRSDIDYEHDEIQKKGITLMELFLGEYQHI